MEEQKNKTEIQEVLEIVTFIRDNAATQKSVDALAERVDNIETKVDHLETKVDNLDKKVDGLSVKMVSKEYLDDKLFNFRGDLVVMMRKEDVKMRALVEVMAQKQLLSKDEANKILSMEPFPQLAL